MAVKLIARCCKQTSVGIFDDAKNILSIEKTDKITFFGIHFIDASELARSDPKIALLILDKRNNEIVAYRGGVFRIMSVVSKIAGDRLKFIETSFRANPYLLRLIYIDCQGCIITQAIAIRTIMF